MNARCWMAGFLALGAAGAAAQAPLKLPSSQGDIRALLRETGDPICVRCGVVTAVRALEQAGQGLGPQVAPGPLTSGNLDSEVGTVPFGTKRAKYEREKLRPTTERHYEVTVRYDDGTNGRVEMNHDPRLQPGDRVQVENGAARRYP